LNSYEVNKFESGNSSDKETLVPATGLDDDKNSFLQSAEILSEHYHLVLPDRTGHGENAREPSRDYAIDGQPSFVPAQLIWMSSASSGIPRVDTHLSPL
jgi:hypothetical protein